MISHSKTLLHYSIVALFALLVTSAHAFEFSPLKGPVWGSGSKTLFVILHGDGGPGRYDNMAKSIAASFPNATVVALNRPGFGKGKFHSKGRGGNIADLYTKRNNDLLAKTLISMRESLKPQKFVVMGHSGGSGQLGTVIGRYPGIVDTAILVSCPCDVPNWRISRRGKNNWVQSQSPHSFIKGISAKTRVLVVIGTKDGNTRMRFSEKYVALAKSANKNVKLVPIQGGTHSWSTLEPTVIKILSKELR